MIHIITVCHMMPEIIAFSLTRGHRTMGLEPDSWLIVNNHWPIKELETADYLEKLAKIVHGEIHMPHQNLGGHGGINFAVTKLKALEKTDLILTYDPDSNPINPGWLKAMKEVLDADPSIPYISLMHSVCVDHRPWLMREVAGHRVASDPEPEMFNVTLWRAEHLMVGLRAPCEYYGGIEADLFRVRKLKGSYMFDFREDPCPIHHPQIYTDWKDAHGRLGTYRGNFDQYVRERGFA